MGALMIFEEHRYRLVREQELWIDSAKNGVDYFSDYRDQSRER